MKEEHLPTKDKNLKILLVDDEEAFRQRLAKAFARRGFTVMEAADGDAALAVMQREQPDRAVIDLRMPGKSGLELVAAAAELPSPPAMLVLTGYGSIATATEAIRLGALAYLPKPADVDDILEAFSHAGQPAASGKQPDYTAPSLARTEWEHINRVLNDCQGNISQAARRLGLHRRTLQRKLQKHPPGI